MSDNPLSGTVSLDTTNYKSGVAELNRQVRVIESGFKAASAGMEDWNKTAEGMELRIKSLTGVIGLQQQKVNGLTKVYNELAAGGKTSAKELEGLQIKINNETATLNKNQLELNQTKKALDDFGTGSTNVGKAVDDNKLKFTELASVISLAKQAAQIIGQVVDETAGKFFKYAEFVKDLSQNLGLSAEETSRLIQVADDAGISISQVESATEMMVKKGVQPSIEKIAELADEYVSLQDPLKRQDLLEKELGKNWTVLVPLLKNGGQAIRDNAAAIQSGLIVTQAGIDQAEQMRVATDNLHDAWDAFTMYVGVKSLPQITLLLNSINLVTGNIDKNTAATMRNAASQSRGGQAMHEMTGDVDAHAKALQAEGEAAQKAAETGIAPLSDEFGDLDAAQWDVHGSASAVGDEFMDNTTRAYAAADAAAALQTSQEKLSAAQDKLSSAQANWTKGAGSDAQSALEKAGVKGDKLNLALDAIDKTMGTSLVDQANYNKALQDAATEYQKTGDLEAYRGKLDAIKSVYEPLDKAIQDATTDLGLMKQAVDALHDKTITITTIHRDVYGGTGEKQTGRTGSGEPAAGGTDYTVPSGFDHDNYIQPVSSGERVIVIPAIQNNLAGLRAIANKLAQSSPGAGSSSVSSSSKSIKIDLGGITVNGNANPSQVRQAANQGLLEAARSVGLI